MLIIFEVIYVSNLLLILHKHEVTCCIRSVYFVCKILKKLQRKRTVVDDEVVSQLLDDLQVSVFSPLFFASLSFVFVVLCKRDC